MTRKGVLVLSGPPCSGKSSVGRLLAGELSPSGADTMHIEIDSLFSLLLPASDRRREDRMLAYDAAHLLAAMLLARDKTVILECTYARREQRLSLLEVLVDSPGTALWIVEFYVSPDEAAQRFRHRQEATDLDESLVRERVETFPHFDQALPLAGPGTPRELALQIKAWLPQAPAIQRDRWAAEGRSWD